MWKQGDLENASEQAININMRFESFAGYLDPFLLGQGPAGAYLRRLGPESVKCLRQDV